MARPAAGSKNKRSQAARADRYTLYEQSVQCPEAELDFVDQTFRDLRGRRAVSLREDFCGTAQVACAWVKRRPVNTAIGVDLDPEPLAWGRARHLDPLPPSQKRRATLIQADVLCVHTPPMDVITAMNFSYWVIQERARLRAYFSRVYQTLVPDGVLFLDAYGGYDAFRVLRERTPYRGYTYVWHQAEYNPITGIGTCRIDFVFADGSALRRAFSYTWRLWSLPEIREVLGEAGFRRVTVYWEGTDEKTGAGNGAFTATEVGSPDAGWIAYLVAEK